MRFTFWIIRVCALLMLYAGVMYLAWWYPGEVYRQMIADRIPYQTAFVLSIILAALIAAVGIGIIHFVAYRLLFRGR
jgi:hypothetical protein